MEQAKSTGSCNIRLITRADDCGSNHSANLGIEKAISAGFIKNISLMAVGPYIEEAASMFAKREDICFGLHAAINSEWDKVKWGPVLNPGEVPSIVNEDGWFYQDPASFADNPPDVGEILREVQAQLDKLLRLGFTVRYLDFHMLPERFVPELLVTMSNWAVVNGLIDHSYFYRCIPGMDNLSIVPGTFEKVLKSLPPGQYFYACHPALDSGESRLCSNSNVSGEYTARIRNSDTQFASNPATMRLCEKYNVVPIRYDEAEKADNALEYMKDFYSQMK